jgi:hypothetical protein
MLIDSSVDVSKLSNSLQDLLKSLEAPQHKGKVLMLGTALVATLPFSAAASDIANFAMLAILIEDAVPGVVVATRGKDGAVSQVAFVLDGVLTPDPADPKTAAYNNMVTRLNELADDIGKAVKAGKWPSRRLAKVAIGELDAFLATPDPELPGGFVL